MDTFHWSLHEIDDTDIESLIPFAFHYPRWKGRDKSQPKRARELYADEMNWL